MSNQLSFNLATEGGLVVVHAQRILRPEVDEFVYGLWSA